MAVHTKITSQQIVLHLKKYSIGELISFQEIIEGIDNSNFILFTTIGKFILTIFENRINQDDLPFFLELKLHLANKNISCPRPILDNSGSAIVDFENKKSIIVSFLTGKTLKPKANGYYDNIDDKHCYEVGKILSNLHLSTTDFLMNRYNDLNVKNFKSIFDQIQHLLEDYQRGLKKEILDEINFINDNWNRKLPSAPAHLDLFPDNVFFDEKNNLTGIIDFYFSANEILIYDFAIAVNAWCFDENKFIESKFKHLISGYELFRKFSDEEKRFLKYALRASAMRFLLTRLQGLFFTAKESLIKIKDPQEYINKLKFFKNNLI
jgi:homoserine kinase type II